jgi:hypothetical protein
VVIVAIGIQVCMQERRTHGAHRNGEHQPEREDTADHPGILAQKSIDVT